MYRLPNVQVMGIGLSTFLPQQRIQCYKHIIFKTYRMRERVSYHPMGLADVIVCAVVVHRCLALSVVPVSLREGSELLERPPLAHGIPVLHIPDESINLPKKLMLLGQVDVMRLVGFYHLLQHLRVV
jgi:hypothetical protein